MNFDILRQKILEKAIRGELVPQNGTSLLLPLNETAFSDFGTPATLFSYSGTAIPVSGTEAFS